MVARVGRFTILIQLHEKDWHLRCISMCFLLKNGGIPLHAMWSFTKGESHRTCPEKKTRMFENHGVTAATESLRSLKLLRPYLQPLLRSRGHSGPSWAPVTLTATMLGLGDLGIGVGPPKSSILIGFSMKWTSYFGGFPPIFGSTPKDVKTFCTASNIIEGLFSS